MRSALRVLPAVWTARNEALEGDFRAVMALPVFRATGVAWAAAKYPDQATRLADSAAYAASATGNGAASAAAFVVAGDTNVYPADAARAARAAAAAAYVAKAAFAATTNPIVTYAVDAAIAAAIPLWSSLSADATRIDGGSSASDIAGASLWSDGPPAEIDQLWREMKRDLLAAGEDWDVWADWYEARLAGKKSNKKLEIARATILDETWNQGPAVINAHIKDLIDQHKRRRPTNDPKAPPDGRSTWDFFLSYSGTDESFARFADGTLRVAGYRVFTQFRDMPTGSNFVREMNKGLAASSRLIALLSPSYVASDHCQAEWNAAYVADPAGTSRKLVPLLIEPCDLDPLAKQIVHKSLVGLSAADATAAILEAVGHNGPTQAPSEPWPGSMALDAMTRASRDVFDVEPGTTHRLRRKSPPRATGAIEAYGFTPEDLYAEMRGGIAEFVSHVCTYRHGNFCFSDRLQSHARKLLEKVPEDFSACNPLNVNRAMGDMLRVLSLDEKAELLPPNDMIANYKSDLNGYYKQLAALFPKLMTFRRQHARDRFTLPDERQQHGLEEFLDTVPADTDAVEPELSKELEETKAELTAAQSLSPAGTEEQKKADLIEPHMSAAAQALPIWNWLANAREKFIKSGKSTEDVAKAIESYQKLYNKLPHMKDYMDWLTSWLF